MINPADTDKGGDLLVSMVKHLAAKEAAEYLFEVGGDQKQLKGDEMFGLYCSGQRKHDSDRVLMLLPIC